jgi:hypothetical protein
MLLEEQRCLEEALARSEQGEPRAAPIVVDGFELASGALQSYRKGNPATRRELILRLSSNRTVHGKNVVIEPYYPLQIIAKRHFVQQGPPSTTRTWDPRGISSML